MNDDFVDFCREHGFAESRAVDVSSGASPLGPSGRVKAVIRKAVKEAGGHPGFPAERFRRLLASRFGVPSEEVVLSSSLDALWCRALQVLGPKKVLVAGPAPQSHLRAAAAVGAGTVVVPAFSGDDFAPDVHALAGQLKGIDLLMLSNPNRITGRLIPPGEMQGLLSAAADSGTATLIDESLMEFTGEAGAFGPTSGLAMVLRTTALFYGLQGLELAFAAVPGELAERISGTGHFPASRLAIEAARAALKDRTYRRQMQEFLSAERRFLQGALGRLPGLRPHASDANVFLLRSGEEQDGPLRAALARAGFFIRDCSGMDGLGRDYLRISVMGHGANRKFARIMRERALPSGG